jgi:hypothetical protein
VIALLAAAFLAVGAAPAAPLPTPLPASATSAPLLAPATVLAKYKGALATLKEPRDFVFEYTLQQTGTRTLEQTHRIFRSGKDERDETMAVNGTRSSAPVVRIFRNRPYRYSVKALAPQPAAYEFTYAGVHRAGKHVDYVFSLSPKKSKPGITFTQVAIDGVTFLPQSVAFEADQHAARGSVSFGKADRYWVARGANAQAAVRGGVAHERLAFTHWRFPKGLPRSTFSMPRPLPTLRPTLLP